ncbi:MAG: NAD(P)-binding protein [Deltaproteobacteria bacterium]|nr:NAD(P)-binding protein [Deltaproteobacteria bacterium]
MPPKFSKELSYPVSFETRTPREQPRTSPCEAGCPAGHAIQRTIYFIQNNRFEEALENVRAKNPFPGTCGRACFHPCEAPCNRTFFDQGLAIRALERAAFDLADREKVRRPKCRPKSGKRVAVVGSGPAGMTAAYFLTLFGHDVTVFEALPFPGGMPRFGIPDYRLPKDIPDREIEDIIVMGVKVRTRCLEGEKAGHSWKRPGSLGPGSPAAGQGRGEAHDRKEGPDPRGRGRGLRLRWNGPTPGGR